MVKCILRVRQRAECGLPCRVRQSLELLMTPRRSLTVLQQASVSE